MEKNKVEQVVHQHLNRWDPENLVEIGKPHTKYKQEVKDIVKEIENIQQAEELAQLLCDALNKRLHYSVYEMSQCWAVGTQMWEDVLKVCKENHSFKF